METWYLPITILPGIGLLILSTSRLIISLNEELERLLINANTLQQLIDQKLSQMRLLTYAMSGLYISTALMVLSGLVSFFSHNRHDFFGGFSSFVLISGVGVILLSLIILVIYSARAVSIRRSHFNNCLLERK